MTIIGLIKPVLPSEFRLLCRREVKRMKYFVRRQLIRYPVTRRQQIKIILGAAETYQKGWYSTNENWLDITNPKHWDKVFAGKPTVTHMVAEHVLEHLTYEEAARALKMAYDHLVPGGRIRIAVPDGYNPNPEYIRHVGINGIGDDAADHKLLLNVDTLRELLRGAGFKVEQLEGYDSNRNLVSKAYDVQDGYIQRSRQNEECYKDSPGLWPFPDSHTSLIMDGIK
jgi:predicted SAM-dependent methyltransferase